MRRARALAVLALAAAACGAAATELQPFEARYEVWLDGKRRGESTMHLQQLPDGSWEHQVEAAGTNGLAALAGAGARHSTRFRLLEGRPRLLEAMTTSEVALRRRSTRTVFDWERGSAHWEGDVKPDQTGPIPLQPGATTSALVNVLLGMSAAGAPPGSVLSFPLYDRGRVREQDYRFGVPETIQVPAGEFRAIPVVTERSDKPRTTTLWFAANLPPTPVRMLQSEKGQPKYELRLVQLTAMPRTR